MSRLIDTAMTATTDEHLQKVGADAFNKFERYERTAMFKPRARPTDVAARRIINLDREVRFVASAVLT